MQPATSEPTLRGKTRLLFQALSLKLDKFVSMQTLQQAIGGKDTHRIPQSIAYLRESVAPFGYRIEGRAGYGYLMSKAAP